MLIDPFLLHALIAGWGVALMSGPLGCFVVWRRMAYFGDTIGHAALLGLVAGFLLQLPAEIGIIACALLIAVALFFLQSQRQLASDTLLGVLAHGALALGLVLIAINGIAWDMTAYLFGDILATGTRDNAIIAGLAVIILTILAFNWRKLLMMTLHPEIAAVEHVHTRRMELLLMAMIAVVVAVSIKIIGMLLITSMLIIPAAAARYFARTPTQMAIMATLISLASVTAGLFTSLHWDTPSGPTIILAALAIFIVARLFSKSA